MDIHLLVGQRMQMQIQMKVKQQFIKQVNILQRHKNKQHSMQFGKPMIHLHQQMILQSAFTITQSPIIVLLKQRECLVHKVDKQMKTQIWFHYQAKHRKLKDILS